jgi:hypothetical protein
MELSIQVHNKKMLKDNHADPPSRGILPTVVCVWVWSSENKQPRHLLWVGGRCMDYETKSQPVKM